MNFIPDIRNLGGRKTISDILSNHYSKLDSVKSVIHSRDPLQSPRNKSQKTKDSRASSRQDFSLRHENHRIKSKMNKTLMFEHQNNIKHMQRRIQDIGSINERKKNKFDPISNPVMFFRDESQNAPGLPSECIQKLLKPPKSSNIYKENMKSLQGNRKNLTPIAGGKESDFVGLVKNGILKEIVGKRIYKDGDLIELFGKSKKVYSKFKPSVVETAIQQIMTDFDL